MKKLLLYSALVCAISAEAFCGLTGTLSTESGGLISGGKTWLAGGEGLSVNWMVSLNADGSWHYQYTFANAESQRLQMDVSHFIISVSTNLEDADVFDFTGDAGSVALGTFGPENSNPGFPAGQSIFGLKINMAGDQTTVGFDSNRAPMWGDFYAKGGGKPKNFAYNTDFGVAVANLHDYMGVPVDSAGGSLFKILVPDTVPEPATLAMLTLGGLTLLRRRD